MLEEHIHDKLKRNNFHVGLGMLGLSAGEAIASGGILCPLCIMTGVGGLALIKENFKR